MLHVAQYFDHMQSPSRRGVGAFFHLLLLLSTKLGVSFFHDVIIIVGIMLDMRSLFIIDCCGSTFYQDALYDYLKERNVDDDMAAFICMYADQKEQTEYTNWLGDMAKFVK